MTFDLIWKGKQYACREISIKSPEIKLDKEEIDINNEPLKKIRNPRANGEKAFVFVNKDGKEETKHFKAIKGKAVQQFTKTEVMQEDKISVENLAILGTVVENAHTYYIINAELKKLLKEMDSNAECFMFKPYTIRGFKAHKAIIYYEPSVDRVLMKLCRGDLKTTEMPETKDVEEVQSNGSSVDEADIVC